jgi:hypothetical protein
MKTDVFDEQMLNAEDVQRFVFAGRALFTIVSKVTGNRFTYKVKAPRSDKDKRIMFVNVLSGPDNVSNYSYLGYLLKKNRNELIPGAKGHPDADSFVALNWLVGKLAAGKLPDTVEFYHAGKCGCCGRTLTVPESIVTGLGPVCAGRME